jgi:hypothetical protein
MDSFKKLNNENKREQVLSINGDHKTTKED